MMRSGGWPGCGRGLLAVMRLLDALGSWAVISVLLWGLLVALLLLRRLRQFLVVLLAWILGLHHPVPAGPVGAAPATVRGCVSDRLVCLGAAVQQLAALAFVLVGILYGLVPEGRWRQTGKWVATALVALVASLQMYLGVEAPTDILVGVAVGVAIPLLGFRLLAPSQVFPISYRRGRSAHLDVGGAREQAIRQALQDQLGLVVEEVQPFRLAGSAGSTPLRIKVKGDPPSICSASCTPAATCAPTAGTSWAGAAVWPPGGREAVQHRAPAGPAGGLRAPQALPGRPARPRPYGVVELTPEREYLLVTEFFDGATELGEAEVDTQVIDDGLGIIRKLWDAGPA